MIPIHNMIMDDLFSTDNKIAYMRITFTHANVSYVIDTMLPDTVKSTMFADIRDDLACKINETDILLKASDGTKPKTYSIFAEFNLSIEQITKDERIALRKSIESIMDKRSIKTFKLLTLGHLLRSEHIIKQGITRPTIDTIPTIERLKYLYE